MTLRLLHVFPSFDAGGSSVRTVEIMNALGAGWSHRVVSMDGRTGAAALVRPSMPFDLHPPRDSKWTVRAFRELLHAAQPDLLLTYNWGAIEAVAASIWRGGPPCLHAEDGFGADEAARLKLRRVWARRLLLRRVYGVVLPSTTLLDVARTQYRLPEKKLIYLPNGVSTERFRPRRDNTLRDSLRDSLGLSPDQFVIGLVGRLRPEKNVGVAIQALARMDTPGAVLVVAGDGPCMDELQRLAASLHLSHRVRFLGAVQDPAPLYSAMDLFCLCSDTEQMPVALLEAMASGLPCVTTNVGDCAAMLDRSCAPFIVPPRDPDAMARAFEQWSANAESRHSEGVRLRARCDQLYGRRAMLQRYEALYREAVASARRRA